MPLRFHCVVAVLTLVMSRASFAADVDLKAELSRPIITAETSLEQTQEFLERRIPRLPEVKTATEWDALAAKWRKEVLDNVVFRGEAAKWRDHPLAVEYVGEPMLGPGYVVKKLRYECLPGMWIPALLYVPEKLANEQAAKDGGKVPVDRKSVV